MITSPKIEKLTTVGEYLEYVPYYVDCKELYNAESLYKGYVEGDVSTFADSYDQIVYKHYQKTGPEAFSELEAMARALHDFNITNSLKELCCHMNPRRFIGVMGGHGLLRTDEMYRKIVLISKTLTEKGFTMVSGGGPGAMEATHLGAWLAGYSSEDADDAMKILSVAPTFQYDNWLDTAMRVMKKYPHKDYISIGVPTWLYGHEPATPFATHIAKLFDNSVRENYILTIAFGGIIYSPGSAGTMQEIFQDAVQNHYLSFGFASPMAFLGEKFWTEEMPAYPFLEKMVAAGKYKNLILSLNDDEQAVVDELVKFSETNVPKK